MVRLPLRLFACLLVLGWAGEAAAAGRGVPRLLSQTGLYSNIVKKVISPKVKSYVPQYPLWSDGAGKSRWIYLPPGATIDGTDPNHWIFPTGTRLWKEFAFNGHRVETRMIEKRASGGWTYAAYAWNAHETEAVLVPKAGKDDAFPIGGGLSHDIPSFEECRDCHVVDGRDGALGFTALQLSPDRDPGSPHVQPFVPGMINLTTLIRDGILVHAPKKWLKHPPRIQARSPRERSAIGYMAANCGGCHNAGDDISAFNTRYLLGAKTEPWTTAVGTPSEFQIPGLPPGKSIIIDPGHPELSTVVFRMKSRFQDYQMPPIGTAMVDKQAVKLISNWIKYDLAAHGGSQQPNERREKK